jgi:hypothetical protein
MTRLLSESQALKTLEELKAAARERRQAREDAERRREAALEERHLHAWGLLRQQFAADQPELIHHLQAEPPPFTSKDKAGNPRPGFPVRLEVLLPGHAPLYVSYMMDQNGAWRQCDRSMLGPDFSALGRWLTHGGYLPYPEDEDDPPEYVSETGFVGSDDLGEALLLAEAAGSKRDAAAAAGRRLAAQGAARAAGQGRRPAPTPTTGEALLEALRQFICHESPAPAE